MTDRPAPDLDELIFDVAIALRDVTLFDGHRRKLTLDDKRLMARQIIEHMIRAGVLFGRRPPTAAAVHPRCAG